MGELIKKSAAISDIRDDVMTTLRRARERGGDWRTLAEGRLGPHEPIIGAASSALDAARDAEDVAAAALLGRDTMADRAVGRVKDEIDNALDRPQRDPTVQGLFPSGIVTYTRATPARAALLLKLLAERLAATRDARATAEQWAGWSAQIVEVQGPLAAAVQSEAGAEAQAFLTEQLFAASVRTAWFDLVRLKRDLLNAGRSEAEIHTVLPDRPAHTSADGTRSGASGLGTTGGPTGTGVAG